MLPHVEDAQVILGVSEAMIIGDAFKGGQSAATQHLGSIPMTLFDVEIAQVGAGSRFVKAVRGPYG